MSNSTIKTNQRLHHIDGIKGLLCFFIMFGHFWNLCRWSNPESPIVNGVTTFISNSILGNTIFAGTFWMYAFLVISGYLLSASKVVKLTDLAKKIAIRYLRFFLLILGACAFIFVISKTMGFHANETAAYFTNGWFQGYYPSEFGVKAILIETVRALFFGGCAFNDPFWVMRDILLSSVIIYLCRYMEKFTKKAAWVCVFIAAIFHRPVIIACLAGFLLGSYKEIAKKIPTIIVFFGSSIVAGLMGYEYLFYTLFFSFVMAVVERLSCIQKFFGMGFFRFLGKISFGVYAFHWPIICSVGSLVLIWGFEAGLNGMVAYGIALVASIAAVTVISVVYHLIIEKPVGKLLFRRGI